MTIERFMMFDALQGGDMRPCTDGSWVRYTDYAALLGRLAAAEKDARAWRNRFVDERMNAYPNEGYEMRRCHAESDANEYIAAFHAAIAASGKGE